MRIPCSARVTLDGSLDIRIAFMVHFCLGVHLLSLKGSQSFQTPVPFGKVSVPALAPIDDVALTIPVRRRSYREVQSLDYFDSTYSVTSD